MQVTEPKAKDTTYIPRSAFKDGKIEIYISAPSAPFSTDIRQCAQLKISTSEDGEPVPSQCTENRYPDSGRDWGKHQKGFRLSEELHKDTVFITITIEYPNPRIVYDEEGIEPPNYANYALAIKR